MCDGLSNIEVVRVEHYNGSGAPQTIGRSFGDRIVNGNGCIRLKRFSERIIP